MSHLQSLDLWRLGQLKMSHKCRCVCNVSSSAYISIQTSTFKLLNPPYNLISNWTQHIEIHSVTTILFFLSFFFILVLTVPLFLSLSSYLCQHTHIIPIFIRIHYIKLFSVRITRRTLFNLGFYTKQVSRFSSGTRAQQPELALQ